MAYITVADLRSEGCSDPPYSKEHLETRIALACRTFDTLTGCFFEARSGYVIKMDGRGHDTLFLPVPPVDVDAITSIVIDDVTLDSDEYEVAMETIPDSRDNPQLIRLSSGLGSGIWPKGRRNIVITGTFGFVDSDGGDPATYTPPALVKDACLRIAVWNLLEIADTKGQRSSQIIEESLRDYRYRLADSSKAGSGGYFGDSKIDNVIALFKQPMMGVI